MMVPSFISGDIHGLKMGGINKPKKTQEQSMYTDD